MRFARSEWAGNRGRDKKLGSSRSRKKHKRLDAICEEAYTRSHTVVEKVELVEGNEEANEMELRRSSRVRRPPVVLDASPAPPKKRRRIDKKAGVSSVDRGKRVVGVKIENQQSTSRSLEEDSSAWRSRLRSRGKCVTFEGGQNGNLPTKGRRKLFEDFDGDNEESGFGIEESDDKEEEFIYGNPNVAKSKRVKALSVLENEEQENDSSGGSRDDKCTNEEEVLGLRDEGNGMLLNIENECVNDGSKDGHAQSKLVEKEELEVQSGSQSKERHSEDNSVAMEHKFQLEKPTCLVGEDQTDAVEVDGPTASVDQAKTGGPNDKPVEDGISGKLDKTMHSSDGAVRPLRIKEGRRCGLCGGGIDGKPPQKLVMDGTVSDNEACSGGSASEEPNYDIWDGFGDEPSWLGRLLGPINDRFGIAGIWVHQQCAVWSPEVYFAGLGCLKNVRAALCRGRALKCSRCGRPGATIGCRVDRCPKTYHLPCARASGSIFDHRKFLIACRVHRHLFQPHGSQYLNRIRKMKVKKLKLDMRKMSNDALRKDIEAEEKWLENCGEDEEFLKRESKRLQRDLLRTAPVYIGGANSDSGMQFQGWESVAGLQDVIQCMKEVVILPLLYPELFSNLGLTPPRGVLLHGYPGTGKTLVVRALIGSCARGDKKIAYFARKGADCLGKYVGDAERQLRLLFQVAEKSQPSIIFFDEIDGLAPCRTRQQDQTHSSVVSTLLALLDGLKSRGSVVVIGATNRPDSIDPALRRPGRFDREIYFPLPSVKDREAILSLHTQKWPKPIGGSLLKWVARRTVGFAGADLQALCTQAAIIALRRSFPLQEVLSGSGERASRTKRPSLPSFTVEERDWLDSLSSAPPPCSLREAGTAANDVVSAPLAAHLVPCLLQPLSRLLISLYLDEHVWLPPPLSKAATSIKNVIISSLDKAKVHCDKWWSNLHDLLQEADTLNKIEENLSCGTILIEDAVGHSDPIENFSDDGYLKLKPSRVQRVGAHPGLLHSFFDESGKKPGFRILISGKPRSGQRHLASCLLHCFVGNVENRKLDLATMSQEGHGDVIQGLAHILMRCASLHPCLIFLPRIDLWAVDMWNQSCKGQSDSPSSRHNEVHEFAGTPDTPNAVKTTSYLWNSFIEQVESICGCSSLMILATSEVPFSDLPYRIRQFFSSEMLNPNQSHPLKDLVPRFLVQIDGNLNRDMMIDTSAAKLSKDLVQYFIHLIHLGEHIHDSSSSVRKVCDPVEDLDLLHRRSDPESAIKPESKNPFASVTSVALWNPVKGKPNLLIALSTFGYQVLLFPHFSELCWVTSKLKGGPCTHINGPWKGWPFNSCIVRPMNSLESVAVTCSSSTTKNVEKSFVVRGLIAIGLLAYRGEYTSLREVSLEVRKVLELLVSHVNAKIQAGKDKYKFFPLLSQVAYFEDMVCSWVYTLRSLEGDAQSFEGSPRLICSGSLNNHTKDSLPGGDDCKQNICKETLHEPDELEQIPQEVNDKKLQSSDLITASHLNSANISDEVAAVVQIPSNQGVLEHSASDMFSQSPLQNGINSETSMQVDVENHAEGGDLGCVKVSNGFEQRDSGALLGDGCHGFGDKGNLEPADSRKCGNRGRISLPVLNGYLLGNGKENSSRHFSRMPAALPADSGRVCMYFCCPWCIVNIRGLLLKLLNCEWEQKGSNWTVEDFHDMVASLSSSLLSAVRKLFAAKDSSRVFDEKLTKSKISKYILCQECKSSRKRLTPMDCTCHSTGNGVPMEPHMSQNSRLGNDLKFLFRDGVLVPLKAEYDASFHCKFETLCLCTLVDCIVMGKEPLD